MHKTDVDPYEAGCVDTIGIRVQRDSGCVLTMEFEPVMDEEADDGSTLVFLSSLVFTADSLCPDFSDEAEGEYSEVVTTEPFVEGLPTQLELASGLDSTVCLSDDIDLDFEGTLAGPDGESHPFSLIFALRGDYWSTGNVDATCESDGSGVGAGGGSALAPDAAGHPWNPRSTGRLRGWTAED